MLLLLLFSPDFYTSISNSWKKPHLSSTRSTIALIILFCYYSLFRPIRHTSYPATFSDDSTSSVASSDLDYNSPLSSFEGGSDTFENPATKFKNFFVDHNSNGFKRPSRSPLPSTLSSVQPLYNEQSTTLAFEPSYDQLRPSSIRPISY